MACTTIGIIGLGYVGSAAKQLEEVYSVEVYDPHIQEYKFNLGAFEQDFVIVCVPTPIGEGGYDMSAVDESVIKWKMMKKANSVLVIKSTIPAGTIDEYRSIYGNNIVHNPEFLSQKTAKTDFRKPAEVIVGGDPECCLQVINMYKGFYSFGEPDDSKYFIVQSRVAELVKTVRNSFYATKVSFFNEIYDVCRSIDINYDDFRKVFILDGEHPWVAKQHTQVPGPDGMFGFGGACLPKDANGLVEFAREKGVEMKVLEAAIASNNKRRKK